MLRQSVIAAAIAVATITSVASISSAQAKTALISAQTCTMRTPTSRRPARIILARTITVLMARTITVLMARTITARAP
jgi:hypothetical protein